MIIPVYKQLGQTPLEALNLLRSTRPDLATSKLTYAGRLDPMATGLLIVLTDDDIHDKEHWLSQQKTYQVEMLLGLSTDSFDTLGVISASSAPRSPTQQYIDKLLCSFVGTQMQTYPRFSSKTVLGKPLFSYALEGKLASIDLPSHEVIIHSIEHDKIRSLSSQDTYREVVRRISLVKGDFRQEKIRESWKSWTEDNPDLELPLVAFTVSCSSGTYMRQLVVDIGEKLKIPSLAYSIKRTRVGDITLDSIDTKLNIST